MHSECAEGLHFSAFQSYGSGVKFNAHSTFDLNSEQQVQFPEKEQRSQGFVSASVLLPFRTINTTIKRPDCLTLIFGVADPTSSIVYRVVCVAVREYDARERSTCTGEYPY